MGVQTSRLTLPTGHYVIAVSGGVDSVVLLDMLVHTPGLKLVVAHFDHGIRTDSAEDAQFVHTLATTYGIPFETKREELGTHTSEEQARSRRYRFLRSVAKKYQVQLVTAHHADDVVETIAINLSRGTGWRGLAVLDSDIVRPLLGMTKQEIVTYATDHTLQWHEDSTNATDAYLRNRLRRQLKAVGEDEKRQLWALRARQVELKRAIDTETTTLLGGLTTYPRYLFVSIDDQTADELLRAAFIEQLKGISPTRPQRSRALLAIKTAKAGTVHHVMKQVQLRIQATSFTIENVSSPR